jgi:hypothetical protein
MSEFFKNNDDAIPYSIGDDYVLRYESGRDYAEIDVKKYILCLEMPFRDNIDIRGDYVGGNKAGRDYIEGTQTNINNTGDDAVVGIGNTVSGSINVNKNILNNVDPQFKNSIIEFENLLNEKLKDIQISDEQKKSLQENIEKLSKEAKDVKPDEVIKNEDKIDEIKTTQICLAEKIVNFLPGVAESIAAVTPLAPFSKAIGKGTGYFAEWIMKKLNNAE